MSQVVDTETAKEFMQETLQKVEGYELAKIGQEVEAKSRWFREKLAPEALPALTPEGFREVLQRVFSTRGKTRKALEELEFSALRASIEALLHGTDPVDQRFDRFVSTLDGIPENLRRDFASELLHFTQPEKHWLWTRWMWDPRTRTGSLPLVTTAAYDLRGESAGEIYMKVGRAVAFVHEVGELGGYPTFHRSIFGTDVFLACVYVIYVYTVLKMRMTNEFNKVMPGLPEFCRRLLGVHVKGAAR